MIVVDIVLLLKAVVITFLFKNTTNCQLTRLNIDLKCCLALLKQSPSKYGVYYFKKTAILLNNLGGVVKTPKKGNPAATTAF